MDDTAIKGNKVKKRKFVETYQEHYKREEKRIKLNGLPADLIGDEDSWQNQFEDSLVENSLATTS